MTKIEIDELEPLSVTVTDFTEGEREAKLSTIWDGDLLNRRNEADMLERFLVSRYQSRLKTGEQDAYSFSLDQTYGAGKSWFLKRFQKQLSLNHPVAFIDAWSDDTADDPFGALITGVVEALKDRLPDKSSSETAFEKLKSEGGKVLLSTGWSIGKEAVKGLASKLAKKAIGEEGKDGIKEILDELASEIESLGNLSHSQFLERREAVHSFRSQLTNLLNGLTDGPEPSTSNLPLFIIVDELDRCRPTYAIKLLEEVKHLFSTPGLIFLFGMNADQLEKSVCAAYGTDFDAKSYLKRFINREYKLQRPSKSDYCRYQLETTNLPTSKLRLPPARDKQDKSFENLDTIASYFSAIFEKFGIELRSIAQCFDHVQTFCDLWPYENQIELFYLLRLVINNHLTGITALNESIEPDDGDLDNFGWWYRQGEYANSPMVFQPSNVVTLRKEYEDYKFQDLGKVHEFNAKITNDSSFVRNGLRDEWSKKYRNTIPQRHDTTVLAEYSKILEQVWRLEN